MDVLKPDETVWRTAHADRAAFLIDVEAYYLALRQALERARQSVLLLGWAFDPRTRLAPDGLETGREPDEVGRVLLELAARRPELDIRLLVWKSALPISAQQEFFPHKAREWFQGTGVQFRLDDSVPIGASHHQKLVAIDGALAFVGGGDIAPDRFDTPAHLDIDLRRLMPSHECHAPRHEVMAMVDGEAARALAELARRRWERATGETPAEPLLAVGEDPWPEAFPAQLTDIEVGIARTQPAWREEPLVDEIIRLTLSAIAAARETIYLENQYFTSPVVAEALAARLAEPDGPEVVLVSTGKSPSWFDRLTMDRSRSVMLWRLQAADVFGRFRAYYPATRGGEVIIVHSKASVFDDRLARVGSANLNNRSMGFDTECELAFPAHDLDARACVAAFRDRLVGHFLGVTGATVTKAVADHGGLIAAIEALNRDGRLQPLAPEPMSGFGKLISRHHLGDPASAEDSWRPRRRRERLYRAAHELQAATTSKSITSGK